MAKYTITIEHPSHNYDRRVEADTFERPDKHEVIFYVVDLPPISGRTAVAYYRNVIDVTRQDDGQAST